MRLVFAETLIKRYKKNRHIFITGDLGFNAFEEMQRVMGNDFVNAGIAEQNMVSVSSGLASKGFSCFVYSIAPFVYARPFEQIRNDICLNNLPVTVVGNGGGYAYGVQGPSHHALEDYGTLLTLQNMRVYIPAFASDVSPIIDLIFKRATPAYLRLSRCEKSDNFDSGKYLPWRRFMRGRSGVLLCVGPIVSKMINYFQTLSFDKRPSIWGISELPLDKLPTDFLLDIDSTKKLVVIEEHVKQGGVGQQLASLVIESGVLLEKFSHKYAKGYRSKIYGSQNFHRIESGLVPEEVAMFLSEG